MRLSLITTAIGYPPIQQNAKVKLQTVILSNQSTKTPKQHSFNLVTGYADF